MQPMTAEQLMELAQGFQAFSLELGQYQDDKHERIDSALALRLERLQQQLLDIARDLNADSIQQRISLNQAQAKQLSMISRSLADFKARNQAANEIMSVAANVLALANALLNGNIQAVLAALRSLRNSKVFGAQREDNSAPAE